MSKYDGLDENDCRQLLLAKLEMLVRWTNGASRMGRFDDLETKQYHEALSDAAELVGLLNRSFHAMRPIDLNEIMREPRAGKVTGATIGGHQ